MKVVSVINYKGGVGKTTLTANLAAYLACLGKNVLLVDMDAQCSLTLSFMPVEQWEKLSGKGKTLKGWFDKVRMGKQLDLRPLIVRKALQVNCRLREAAGLFERNFNGAVSLIPSDINLLDVDLDLAPMLHSRQNNARESAEKFTRLHGILREHIHSPALGKFDAVLVDCPPNFNIVTKTAIIASDAIVTPVIPDEMSTRGIRHLLAKCDELANGRENEKGFNGHLKVLGKKALPIPNIQAIVPMIWKVTSTGSGDLSESHEQFVNNLTDEIPDILRDGKAEIIDGFRHRASFFAEAERIPVFIQPPLDLPDVWKSVADTVQNVAAKLGWSAPDNVRLSEEWDFLSLKNPLHSKRPSDWKLNFVQGLRVKLQDAENKPK